MYTYEKKDVLIALADSSLIENNLVNSMTVLMKYIVLLF